MADLLHADALQQLEVSLLGSLATQVIDLLSGGLLQPKPSTSAAPAWPHLQSYTSNPLVPLPTCISVVGVPTTSEIPAVVVPTMQSSINQSAPLKAKISDDSQCHHITPTPIRPSSTSSMSFLVIVMPELAISVEAYPKYINGPGGGKDYLCCLCPFRHSNLDSIMTHVRKHFRHDHQMPCIWQRLSECCIPP